MRTLRAKCIRRVHDTPLPGHVLKECGRLAHAVKAKEEINHR